MTKREKPSLETGKNRANGAESVISDRVESALRELLSEEVVELTREGRGGSKCWPAVILKIAAIQSRLPDAPRHPLAHLIVQVLDFRREVPETHRTAVIHFCRTIAEQARGMEFGHLHHLKKIVRPFAEEVLKPLGEDRMAPHLGKTLGRNLTVQQLISRLDSHQPLEVQAAAVKVLPNVVNLELRNAPREVQERQLKLQTLHQAVGMVGNTKYFKSLEPKMRNDCQSKMNDLRQRIDKSGRRDSI
ncbi:MAG: hypothetical protein JXM70_24165 [Pirellulales bacterium]|nr:hypothetical protein [Pirellulales bacterium]